MRRSVNKIMSIVLIVLMLMSLVTLSGVAVSADDSGSITLIDKLTATVTEPVAGEVPDYVVPNEVENATITQVFWWRIEDDNSGTSMKSDEKFVEGRMYECDIRFQVNGEGIRFADNATGTVNGENVEVYTNGAYTVCTLYAYFICESADSDLSVIFTEDSKAQCNGRLAIDVEAMAELSENFMEEYFSDGINCCWYVDGVTLAEYTDHNLDITEEYCGKTVYVDVFYGSKKVTSEILTISHYEAPHICEYDFENPDSDTATCEVDGVYTYECIDPDCDNISTRPSPATGHEFSEWEETLEPGCTNDGEKQHYCLNCFDVETDVIPSFGGHTNDDEDSVCDVCGTPVKNSSSDDETSSDEASNDEQDPLNDFYVGDVDLDGKVTIKDATMIQKALADILTLSYESETLADVDRDGKITIKDATAIQKYLAGLESGTAVGILLGEVKG